VGLIFAALASFGMTAPSLQSTQLLPAHDQSEGCMECHAGMTGFAPGHDPRTIGCAICHLGERNARTAEAAHKGMTLTPGNLSVVRQTCATAACHEAIGERVRGSLMNTMSGVVAVDKYVFGENPDLDRPFVVSHLGRTPADSHLRTLCASCHLGNDKPTPAPLDESTRGGGCSACHLDYGDRAQEELARRGRPGLTPLSPTAHPMISVQIPDVACFGCHSRSGRIATNYEGWHETTLTQPPPQSPGAKDSYRVLADGRVFEKMPADIHFTKGLSCTDCHVASEVMGDGQFHPHEENAVAIACLDCHSERPPVTRSFAELDPETQMLVALRGLAAPDRPYVATRSGQSAYPNVFVDATGATRLIVQRSGATLQPKPLNAACGRTGTGHATLECRTCHSAWASQCVSCHTQAAPREPGWDHLDGRLVSDSWRETSGQFFADPPALGVIATQPDTSSIRVTTVVPGMILTINRSAPADKKPDKFHRFYAPTSPHTITSRARDCQSCHSNPSALGYGRGVLNYEVSGATGRWHFTPEQSITKQDGLPADAWIGFLQSRSGPLSTRSDVRPFTIEEQQRILRVGACLTCHAGDSAVMQLALKNFSLVLERCSSRCALPQWP
jgi:hypothetical protein